jgi:hypothetical protein
MSKEKDSNPLNTLVIDPEKGYGLEHVDKPKGRLWRYGKLRVYLMLRRNGDDTLEPLELPQGLTELPEKLYRGLFWDKETEILYSMRSPWLEKLNLLGTYILIIVLLFFMYLIYSSA